MSDVVLENTCDIKCIFILDVFVFFLLLNYLNMATEKNTAVCVEKDFLTMRSRISRTLYLKLNPVYMIPIVVCVTEVELYERGGTKLTSCDK